MKDFKARFWSTDKEGYTSAVTDTYYAHGNDEANKPLCINTKEGQFVLDTNSIIKLLKKYGRI